MKLSIHLPATIASALLLGATSLAPLAHGARAATVTTLKTLPLGELPTGLIETPDGSLFGALMGYSNAATQDYAYELLPPKTPGGTRRLVTFNYQTQCYVQGTIGNFVNGPDGIYGTNFADGNGYNYIVQFSPRVSGNSAILVCSLIAQLGNGPSTNLPYNVDLLGFGPDGALYAAATQNIAGTPSFELLKIALVAGNWVTSTAFLFPAGTSNDTMQLHADGSISGTIHTVLSGQPELFTLRPPTAPGGSWTYTPLFGPLTVYQDHPVTMDNAGNFYGIQVGSSLPGDYDELVQYAPPATPGGAWSETPIFTTTRHPLVQLDAGPVFLTGGDLAVTEYGGVITSLAPNAGAWSPTSLQLGHTKNFNQGGFAPLTPGSDGRLYGMTYGSPGLIYQVTP